MDKTARCWAYEPKTEQKSYCSNCTNRRLCDNAFSKEYDIAGCDEYKAEMKADKHTDCNHCEEARKSCAMTNACPNKHYRPFRDINELINVWKEKSKQVHSDYSLTMPYIWVRKKLNFSGLKGELITRFEDSYVDVNGRTISLHVLFTEYEFLDGSPCGVEE